MGFHFHAFGLCVVPENIHAPLELFGFTSPLKISVDLHLILILKELCVYGILPFFKISYMYWLTTFLMVIIIDIFFGPAYWRVKLTSSYGVLILCDLLKTSHQQSISFKKRE